MNTIEEKMQLHKQHMNQIKAPAELEDRLRQALHRVPDKKRRRSKAFTWGLSAAAALLIFIATYQYPAFAYYGVKLLQEADLNSLDFSEVAEHGYGQTVNKSKTLKDGTIVTIDGVIADDNAFMMYYTIDLPGDNTFNVEDFVTFSMDKVKGFMTDSRMTSGSGGYSKDRKQFHGVDRFLPVSPFSRTLTTYVSQQLDSGKRVVTPISFKFEANKAMKSIIKQELSEAVQVDEGKVHFDSLTASPTSTVIRGHYEMDDGKPPYFPGKTRLLVNGAEVASLGYRADYLDRMQFEFIYDVLPMDKVETVQIVVDSVSGYEKVTEPISLAAPSDQSIRMGNEKLWIRSVTKTESGYDIVIARKQFTILDKDRLFVQAGGKKVPISAVSVSQPWDIGNGNVLWEQTYSVQTQDKPESLLIGGYKFIKPYNKTITIPVSE